MDYIELNAIITPLEVGRDILTAQLAEVGFESFVEEDLGLKAYIQKAEFKPNLLEGVGILKDSNFEINYTTATIEDKNWNEVWEKNFDPINVNNECYIRAPFHSAVENIAYDIIIEPKMSFGTGHHETTFLMVERMLEMDLEEKNVLDMGCGTGVLAILAKKKNANKVLAIDIDEWAYENTLENVERNENLEIEVKKGGVEQINGAEFDVVIANINRNILLNDMVYYVTHLTKNGDLLLSGFFSSDKEILLAEAAKSHLKLIHSTTKNDWTLLHLKKG